MKVLLLGATGLLGHNVLLRLMAEHLGVKRSELTDDTPLDDIMDELDLIELIMAIEEEFNLELPDDIDELFLASPNPYVQIFQDTLDGKLRDKSEEEIEAMFEKAADHQDKVEKTVKDFIDLVAPYLP